MKSHAFNFLLSTVLAVSTPFALAVDRGATHEHREHGAHVHGIAALSVANDERALDIDFESPAINVLGFEHAVRDAAERQRLDQVVNQLKDASALFILPGDAGCVAQAATVDSSLLHKQITPADASPTDAHHHDSHADFDAHYHFECQRPAALTHMAVQLFQQFKGIESIQAQWLTAVGQNAKVLTPGDARIVFQPR